MLSKNNEKRIEEVQKVLGKPAFTELTDHAWKIRTKLIIVSVISIAIGYFDLTIEPSSTILGLKFVGLNDFVIRTGLIVITLYHLIHFVWTAWDKFMEWRLRITGTQAGYGSWAQIGGAEGDYPGDSRQATLYNWWTLHTPKIGNMSKSFKSIEDDLKKHELQMQQIEKNNLSTEIVSTAVKHIKDVNRTAQQLKEQLQETHNQLSSYRIPASLERFDNWFKLFLRSQHLRWILLEVGLPIGLGIWAMCLLYPN